MTDYFEDDDIRFLQEEYPDGYACIMKILEGDYGDEAVR